MTEQSSLAIQVLGLTKKFGHFVAVNNVSFEVQQGEIFGFLGPNGAGKNHHHPHAAGCCPPPAASPG